MPTYTISKDGYIPQSGSFTWADSNINVTLEKNPSQSLYAWSWTPGEYSGAQITTCYTTTPTPTTSDYIYYANGVTIPSNTIFYSGIGGSFYTTSNTPIASATSNSITLTGDGSNISSGGSN